MGSLSYIYITWAFRGERDYILAGHSENEQPAEVGVNISANFVAKLTNTLLAAVARFDRVRGRSYNQPFLNGRRRFDGG